MNNGEEIQLSYTLLSIFKTLGFGGSHNTVFKIMISDILGGNEDKQTRHLVLGLPSGFDAGLFKRISDSVNLYDYSIKKWSIKDSRISVLLLIFFIGLRKAYKRTMGAFKRNTRLW